MSNNKRHQRNFTTGLFAVISAIASLFSVYGDEVTVSDRLEMFICNDAIESIAGDVEKVVIKPTAKEVVLETNAITEGRSSAYWSIFKDGSKFRMYYRGSNSWEQGDPEYQDPTHDDFICTAESSDGINWTRPSVGNISFDGSTDNNIVKEDLGSDTFTVFLDTKPNVASDEKYKSLGRQWADSYGDLLIFKSPDGYIWTPMNGTGISIAASEERGQFDSQNLAFWDNTIDKYRIYFRKYISGWRTVVTATSDDCFNWVGDTPLTFTVGGPGEEILETGVVNGYVVADPGTEVDYGQTSGFVNNVDCDGSIHLYTNAVQPYFRNPGFYIGFPTRLITENGHLPSGTNDYPTEPLLMASRDGKDFHFFRNNPVVAPSDPTNRDGNRSNYMQLGMLELPSEPGKISVYANESYMEGDAGRLRRFVYRTDGFVAIRGGSNGGTLTTKTLNYSGNKLLLNYVTQAGGYIRVEVLNTSDQVIGATSNLSGDVIDSEAVWASNPELNSGTVKLRFTVKDADLYSYRFTGDAPPPPDPDYTLTYFAGANGSITGDLSQIVDAGANGTEVTAVPDVDYHFVSWSDGVTTATRTDTNVQNDITVTANFAEDGGTTPLTVLEDAEDGDTAGWAIYDDDPAGATITNVIDPADINNRAISLSGTEIYNGFKYTFAQPITETSNIQWKMKCSEAYEIFIECQTTSGLRYLRYKPISVNGLGTDKYIDFGLGESTISGNWVTISRDIAAEIHEAQPGTDLISMDAFLVRGTCLIDDIAKGTSEDTPHSADANSDWSISQTEVDAFIADYANNSNTVSGGNGSFDDANRITMRETLRVIYLYNGGGAYKRATGTVDDYDLD